MDTMVRGRLRQPDAFWLSWAEAELRGALERSRRLDGWSYEIFGQGSRVNNTALDETADIDLVLMATSPGSWESFRDDVLAALGESYEVRMGRRCLNVVNPGSLFGEMVDILVATEHDGGVSFRDLEGRPIVNFPKQHRLRGDEKDLRTGGRFKEAVRTVKRLRKRAERDGLLAEGVAPSYLLECLLFNVPDEVYGDHHAALEWLRRCDPATLAGLFCQHGLNRIFGPGPDQWAPGAAATIIDVLHRL